MSVLLLSFLPFMCKAQQCSLLLLLFHHFILTYTANPYPKFRTSFLPHFSDLLVSKDIFDHILLLKISSTFSSPSFILFLLPKLTLIFDHSMSQACDRPLSPDILGSLRFCSPFPMLYTGNTYCIYAFSTVPFPLVWAKIPISWIPRHYCNPRGEIL